jgi:hypothetical protein
MTALSLRPPHAFFASPRVLFGRLLSGAVLVLDVFAEAQQQAIDAHRKFPFGDW